MGLILLYIGIGLKKWINQEEMPLEKYEDFLKLSVKQFYKLQSNTILQSNPISLGQIMCVFEIQTLLLLVAINPNKFPKELPKLFVANYSYKFV